MTYDIALTVHGSTLLVHEARCKLARYQAFVGNPVLTMLGCERIPTEYPWHTCLTESGSSDNSAPRTSADPEAGVN